MLGRDGLSPLTSGLLLSAMGITFLKVACPVRVIPIICPPYLVPDSELERLKALNSIAREEISYRRNREQHIFAWSSAILVSVVTAILVAEFKAGSLLSTVGGKAIATALIILLSFGSARWQMKQKRLLAEVQRVSSSVMNRMGLLDFKQVGNHDPITADKWKKWGDRKHTWEHHIKHPGKILTTCLLGIAAVVTLWAR